MLKLLLIFGVILADNVYSQRVSSADEQFRQPGEISQKKCREYSSYVQEKNDCGHKIVKRIVGGERAGRTEFPHMVRIGYSSKRANTRVWLCGGSLISEQYILTTASCLSTVNKDAEVVVLGVTNLNDTDHKQEIKIAEKIIHPKFKRRSFYDDIGLIKLERPIEIDSYIRPACLYSNSQIRVEKAIATGWGKTDDNLTHVLSDDLHKVTLDIIDNDFCTKSLMNKNLPDGIRNDTQVCTGGDTEGRDTCTGDAGGPLQIYHSEGDILCVYDVIGVTSFGRTTCRGEASVYTRVSYYLKWIEDIVWPESS
ncbi:serine protease snake-like [Zophobas morio]|uniref:serine protease snake-like n=1 Tax=Zophobas morio TaxID=2755281 RepID=UPI003082CDF1